MANFIVSFRIASDSGYSKRYDSFVAAAHELASGPGHVWDETSSFMAFAAQSTASDVCDRLYFNSEFDSSKDMMLVIDSSTRRKATRGPVKYPNLLEGCLGF